MNDEKQFTCALTHDDVTLYREKKSIEVEHSRKLHDNIRKRCCFSVRVDMLHSNKRRDVY